jgi:Uma2 family endonuclease
VATSVGRKLEPDRVITFQIRPGTLPLFRDAIADEGPRIKCYKGSLTLVSPGEPHESSDRRLGILILAICEVLKIPIYPLGATYHGRRGDTGYEPDESYYVQSFGTAKKGQVPDLAIEVVVTNPETKALRAGELLGIPEIWVWDLPRRRLVFHQLSEPGAGTRVYRAQPRSLAFPFLTPEDVLGRVGEPVEGTRFDAGSFSAESRKWARRVLLPRLRAGRKRRANGQ